MEENKKAVVMVDEVQMLNRGRLWRIQRLLNMETSDGR